MHKKMRVGLTATLALALLSASSIAPAQATNAPEKETSFEQFLVENEVSSSVRQELQAKVESGEALDSAQGIEPVSEDSWIEGGERVTRLTYPDGSVSVTRLEIPVEIGTGKGQVSPQGTIINGCSVTSGSGWATYKNCRVQGDNGLVYLSFRVDYERYVGKNAKILRTHTGSVSTRTGWSATLPTREVYRPTSSPNIKALVRYATNAKQIGGLASETFYTSFWLDYKGAASVSFY